MQIILNIINYWICTWNVRAIDHLRAMAGSLAVVAGTRDKPDRRTTVGRFWRLFGVSDDVATTTVAVAAAVTEHAITYYNILHYIKLYAPKCPISRSRPVNECFRSETVYETNMRELIGMSRGWWVSATRVREMIIYHVYSRSCVYNNNNIYRNILWVRDVNHHRRRRREAT